MKKLLFAFISMLYLSSCSTGQYTASREYDDVYYTSDDKIQSQPASAGQQNTDNSGRESVGNDNERFSYENEQQPDYTTSEQRDGDTYITNNYYDEDDYYDYAYTSRIRRFYHPYGWSYYDSYYTNSYWYDYNPYSWGVSIYLGYNFWHPHHSWGFRFGYPYHNSWYDPWYSPYYSHWGGYNHGYAHGYNHGYYDGYYAGLYNGTFNPYYFNSHDSYSYYYGPRSRGSALNTGTSQPVGQLYAQAVSTDKVPRDGRNSLSDIQPFNTPKHYSLQPDRNTRDDAAPVRDTRDTRDNAPVRDTRDVKDTRDNAPVRDTRDVKDTRDNAPVRDTRDVKDTRDNAPVRDTRDVKDIRNDAPVRDSRNNDVRTPASDGGVKPQRDTRDDQPVRNPQIKNDAPVRNQSPAPVYTPRNDEPVRTPGSINDDRRNQPQRNEIKNTDRPKTNVKTEKKQDIRLPRQDRKSGNERSNQQIAPQKQQAPVYQSPPARQDNNRNSNSNSNGRQRR